VSQIVTGEAVALDLRVARIGSRSVAAMIDAIVKLVALWLVVLLFGQLVVLDGAAAQAILLVVILAVTMGYPVAMETLWRGRTLGKAAMGLRVVRDDGGPIRFRHAFIRGLLAAVVELPGFTLFVAPIVTSLVNEHGKRLGDIAAGTLVIQERVPTRMMGAVPMPAPLAGWAATLDLTRVPNELALAARQFLDRANELAPQARDQMGASITHAIVSVISPPPPAGAPGWAIIAAVLAERRRRDELRMQEQRRVQYAAGSGSLPTWQGPQQPGWRSAPSSPWGASAPPTGAPTAVPAGPPVPQAPYYSPAPPVPPGPTPVPSPSHVPPNQPDRPGQPGQPAQPAQPVESPSEGGFVLPG
jgi:uncharacterized RDD family membrane protein YckC